MSFGIGMVLASGCFARGDAASKVVVVDGPSVDCQGHSGSKQRDGEVASVARRG